LKIIYTKKIIKDAVLVFIVNDKESFKKHPFFNDLSIQDRDYFLLSDKDQNKEEIYDRIFFLNKRKIFVLGIPKNFNHRKSIIVMRRVIALAKKERADKILINFDDFKSKDSPSLENLAEVLATQLEIANFEFIEYKQKDKSSHFFVKEVYVFNKQDIQKELNYGKIIGEEINNARFLSNMPGGEMTPARLAEAAVKSGKKNGFKVKILNENQIKKLKMGGIIGVAKGSSEKPKFIILEYFKGKKDEKPIVLVGKGVTFDTGGLNIKGDEYMNEMHMDMSGGATVIHVLAAVARLKVKKNLVGLIPAVENMPSGSSYRPGDILKTMSGKTIEVLNTDAEGRIILADALEYAKKYKPKLIIDIATLTGAAMVALGQKASAIFSTDEKIINTFKEIGEKVGEYVWPLPLWEEYESEIKGTFGEVANLGKTRYGGAIIGAVFLWQFVKDYSGIWVHIDIAPRMTAIEGEFLAKGATGPLVALLTKFLRL
jgi:leucyl aminopeptidase